MRIPQSYIQKCKVVAHGFQVLLIFIAWCITISVLTKDGETGGATKFYFALVCLVSSHLNLLLEIRTDTFVNSASSPSPASYTS